MPEYIGSLKPTKKEAQRIIELRLRDLAVYSEMKEDLIYVDYPLLFETVTSELRYFYSTEYGMKAVRSGRTNTADTRRSTEYRVLPIMLPNKARKYLCQAGKKLPEIPLQYENATPNQESENKTAAKLQTSKNLDVFHTLDCDKLVFTDCDRRLFRTFAMDRTLYEVESVAILKHCHKETIHKSIKINSLGESLVTNHRPETLEKYGKHAGVLLFLVANLHQLSLAQQVERPAVNSRLLLDRCGELYNIKAKAAHLQQLLYIALKEERFADRVHLFMRLLLFRLGAYYDVTKELEADGIETARERISAMGVWVKCVTLSEKIGDGLDIFLEENHNLWSRLKTLYHKIEAESDQAVSDNIQLKPPNCLRLYGKIFGRDYIRDFYDDMQCEFEKQWDKLNRALTMTPVEKVGIMFSEDRDIPLVEDVDRAHFSFKDMFPKLLRDRVLPSKRQQLTEHNKREILAAFDKMTVYLMWMVWFAAGVPYTFSELQILAYAGRERNIYVDDELRCIKILTDRYKKEEGKITTKWLDKRTSYYLVYYVIVLRTVQINLLGEDYEAFEPPREGEVDTGGIWKHIGNTPSVSRKEASAHIMDRYLFLDAAIGHLISQRRFLKLNEQRPYCVAPHERLSFRQLKLGRIALLRQYVDPCLNGADKIVWAVSRLSTAHFAALDTSNNEGELKSAKKSYAQAQKSMPLAVQEEIGKLWISWVGFDEEKQMQLPGAYRDGDMELQKEGLNPDDLVHAGRALYGERFTFCNSDQYLACVNAYLSEKRIIAVQAPPGFGKSLVSHLPLVCYTMRKLPLVSFIFVPFVGLLAGAMIGLEAGGNLRVGSVEKLLNDTHCKGSSLLEVYVGTFDDAAGEDFIQMINRWGSLYPKKKLGIIVFDEF